MSFGYARAEILGGLINGSFLLSLSLYIVLEAIPRLLPSIAHDGFFLSFLFKSDDGDTFFMN